MTAAAKIKHPDAVFGPDDDVLIQLVDRLRVTDIPSLTPSNQNTLAQAISAAARRLVTDYDTLARERDDLTSQRNELTAKRVEIEAREAAVTARETLLGLHPARPKRNPFHFWK